MKNPGSVRDLRKTLGAPSSETVESLRLLRAFVRLSSGQRSEVIKLVERLATDPAPVRWGRRRPADIRGEAR